MSAALAANERGADARAAALNAVEDHVQQITRLMTAAGDLQERAERLVPQLQDAVPYDEVRGFH